MAIQLPQKFEHVVQKAKEKWLRKRSMTREELRSFIEDRISRDHEFSPNLGSDAPDFEVELLDSLGNRTGEVVRLSSNLAAQSASYSDLIPDTLWRWGRAPR